MKINVEVDITPEELRRFMGLPDVQALQQRMMDNFEENMVSSQDQQLEFFRSMINNSLVPWQGFLSMLSNAAAASNKKDD